MKDFFTTGEVAKICGVANRTIVNYCNDGLIRTEKTILSSHRRIHRKDLVDFLKSKNVSLSILESYTKIKILVVEDDDVDQKSIARILDKSFTNTIDTSYVDNGIDALLHIGSQRPDLVLLDLTLPKMDGFEVCQRLKNNDHSSDIKIMVLTAHQDEKTRNKAFKFGADAFHAKPIDEISFIEDITKMTGLGVKKEI